MTRQPQDQNRGPVFVIKLRPTRSDSNCIHGLRAILKRLLRTYGFVCIAAFEEECTTSK